MIESVYSPNEMHFYLFTHGNKYYYYNYDRNVILQITYKLFSIINKYQNGENLDNEEIKYIREMDEAELLNCYSCLDYNNESMPNVAYLSFAPTYHCNFSCSYCFGECGSYYKESVRSFSEENLLDMLNCFFYKLFPQSKHYRIDFVGGGEPLLGFSTIKETIYYCEQFEKKTGKMVSIWLCCNGSLLTDEIIEFLSKHNVSIGISIDGDKPFNDMHRKFANGCGTYDEIVKGIYLIKNSCNVSNKFKNIWGLCSATHENCNFTNILIHLKSLGFENAQIRLIRSNKGYNITKIVDEYERMSSMLLSTYKNGDLELLRMILNDNDQFGKVLKRVMLGNIVLRRCNAGINKVTICPDGTIYPCDSLVGNENYIIGTLKNGILDNAIFNATTVDTIPKCRNCDIKYLCGGDCYYNSLKKTNDIMKPDKEYCQLQRAILHISLILLLDLQLANEDLFRKLIKEIIIKEKYHELHG